MARNRGERIKVFVKIGQNLKYGFRTQKTGSNQHGTLLGHEAYDGDLGVFFGADSPKPNKAVYTGTNTFSSFIASNKIKAIKKLPDWEVLAAKSRQRGLQTGAGKTKTVCIDMPGGWSYAWNISSAEANLGTSLGFTVPTTSTVLVWGVNDPKPPRATKQTADGTVSTFIEPKQSTIDAAKANGFTVSAVAYDLITGE
jgi:hypothetical protein